MADSRATVTQNGETVYASGPTMVHNVTNNDMSIAVDVYDARAVTAPIIVHSSIPAEERVIGKRRYDTLVEKKLDFKLKHLRKHDSCENKWVVKNSAFFLKGKQTVSMLRDGGVRVTFTGRVMSLVNGRAGVPCDRVNKIHCVVRVADVHVPLWITRAFNRASFTERFKRLSPSGRSQVMALIAQLEVERAEATEEPPAKRPCVLLRT